MPWNYNKLRHLKWIYYKVRQVLQSAMIYITKCDDLCNKMRCQCTIYQTNMFKISGRQKSFNELCIKSRAFIQLYCFPSTYRSKWVVRNIGNNKNRATWESPAHVPFLVYEKYYASYCMWSSWVTAALLQVITVYKDTIFIFSRNIIWMERQRWKFPFWF